MTHNAFPNRLKTTCLSSPSRSRLVFHSFPFPLNLIIQLRTHSPTTFRVATSPLLITASLSPTRYAIAHADHHRTLLFPLKIRRARSFDEAHSPPPTLSLPLSTPLYHPSFPSPSFQVPTTRICITPLLSTFSPAMKLSVSSLLSNLTTSKKRNKSKKSRSISRLDAPSFDSTTSSSSDESVSTPKSVLRNSFNDVKIRRHELEALLRRLCTDPLTDEEVSAIIAAEDGQGCVTIADLGKIDESDGEEELKEAFKVFDANGDGKISAEELLQVFLAMGDACSIDDCKRMIGGVDSDGDGLVCFEDFAKMMECRGEGP